MLLETLLPTANVRRIEKAILSRGPSTPLTSILIFVQTDDASKSVMSAR